MSETGPTSMRSGVTSAHRDESRERNATLVKRPERGTAQGFGKRIGGGTVETISQVTEIGVGTSLEVGLERTERALATLGDGTDGLCDLCGKPIAPKRLQAVRNVVLCIECAAARPQTAAPRRRSLGRDDPRIRRDAASRANEQASPQAQRAELWPQDSPRDPAPPNTSFGEARRAREFLNVSAASGRAVSRYSAPWIGPHRPYVEFVQKWTLDSWTCPNIGSPRRISESSPGSARWRR
jgi:DnaK suppressor protein